MEESRKVYGWLVRDRNAAVGCSFMWAWRGMVSSKQWKLGLTCFPLFYSSELVKVDKFRIGFFQNDNFVTSCYTTCCAIVNSMCQEHPLSRRISR